jgi:tight adherence protein C
VTEFLILGATFLGVLLFSTLVVSSIARRREVSTRLADADVAGAGAGAGPIPELNDLGGAEQSVAIRHYFDVIRKDTNPNSLPNRLLRAGFFSPQAGSAFQALRAASAIALFVGVFLLFDLYFPRLSRGTTIAISMMVGASAFFGANILLERMGVAKEKAYRRLFPEFLDMLIVCVDAGLSIEAAADRVAREFLVTRPDFGLHLSIMMLEVRGGRRLRDALANLGTRLRIQEAKSLATLFRQSEELGSDVTKSLRVYSKEMRQLRMLRAEEKANALPIKMLLPLGAFLFPLSLIIVLVPILMRVIGLLGGMGPG